MCTVTLIPQGGNDFILTSNRDEAPNRKTISPEFYEYNNVNLLYPKDKLAGGSWIGVSEKKRVLCVLNGGFKMHQRRDFYRLSRGVVLKDLLIADDIIEAINAYDLNEIEPFTLVIVNWDTALQFFQLVWDGEQKHFQELPLAPKIWSSSSLYSDVMKKERLEWFQDFKAKKVLDRTSILQFHKTAGTGNTEYGVVMDRSYVRTTSITQVSLSNAIVAMNFEDFQTDVESSKQFNFAVSINE